MAFSAFSGSNPCGYAGMRMVQTSDLGGPNSIEIAKQEISRQFISQLKISELTEVTGFEA